MFCETRDAILTKKREKTALIAAHRGTHSGYIVQNTIAAYENALRHGADIIEVDAAKTTDGTFYAFHDGQERVVLGVEQNIRTMTHAQVDELPLRNDFAEAIDARANRLDDVLEHFKGKCLINIDRSWFYWPEIIRTLKRHSMEDQLILKSPAKVEYLSYLQEHGGPIMYAPILYTPEEYGSLSTYKLNLLMAEVIFGSEAHPLASPAFVEKAHGDKVMLWVNAITINDVINLCAHRDDYHTIIDGPDGNWGWLLDRGFDVIQTDFPLLLRTYLNEKGQGHCGG